MLSVSSKVMFPELPDARMDTRKPIAFPQCSANKFPESSQTPAVPSTRKTVKSSTRKGNGRGDDAPRPFRTTASDVYSAAEVQRKPNETVGL